MEKNTQKVFFEHWRNSNKFNLAMWSASPLSAICRNNFAWRSVGGVSLGSTHKFASGKAILTAEKLV